MSKMDSIDDHIRQLKLNYDWLKAHMPSSFFKDNPTEAVLTAAHCMMDLAKQENFILSNSAGFSLGIALHEPHLDLKIFKKANYLAIQSYETYLSKENFPSLDKKLYLAVLRHAPQLHQQKGDLLLQRDLLSQILVHYPELIPQEFYDVHDHLTAKILQGMTPSESEELFHLIARALIRDHLQFYLDDHLKLFFAWKNVPKNHFLENLALLCKRHHLFIENFSANFIPLKGQEDLLVMHLHLKKDLAPFDREDFLRELSYLKFGIYRDAIDEAFVESSLLTGNHAHLLRAMLGFAHQFLVYADSNVYSKEHIEEAALRHPELTAKIVQLFEHKFDPQNLRFEQYEIEKNHLLQEIVKIDSGNHSVDTRRKNILKTCILFTEHCLKTNFYRDNRSALSFRIDPEILHFTPYDRKLKFPELPFGIFYFSNRNFTGFQIRFKDLSRGGLRTVAVGKEQTSWEINNVFFECYNLAFTQQKKNKDIPEGGSKAIIFCDIHPLLQGELEYQVKLNHLTKKEDILKFQQDFRWKIIYESQRAFIHSFLTLINCSENGELKAKNVIDYYKKPEYIYLGPDENMHNSMIDWIAEMSEKVGYKPKKAFISSKPKLGINHKEFGITSNGLHTCLKVVLDHLHLNPKKNPFTVKISGGPDGDVAGNELLLLAKDFPDTAKIVAITDGTGTIRDLDGLNHSALGHLFEKELGIKHYPKDLLSEGAFLLDITTGKESNGVKDCKLLLRREQNKLIETYIPPSESTQLFRMNLLKVQTDIFIPAGGRPRTLNQTNFQDFLDENGHPTSKIIVEGANLYLTYEARHALEEKGVIIIKDSSANKGGVVCSSFEVLSGLVLTDEEFLTHKKEIVDQILQFIDAIAKKESLLILKTHDEMHVSYTQASDLISEKINSFTYQILDHLNKIELSLNKEDPFNLCLMAHCLPVLRSHSERILKNIPSVHKKAIIASYIAANTVYKEGLHWEPSINQILPYLIQNLLPPKR